MAKVIGFLINQDMNTVYSTNQNAQFLGKDTKNKRRKLVHLIAILEGRTHMFDEVSKDRVHHHFGFPIMDEQGIVRYAVSVLVIIDIEQKNVASKLAYVNQKLTEIAHFIAHDFRSPISTMLGLVYLWNLEKSEGKEATMSEGNMLQEVGRRLNLLDSRVKVLAETIDELDSNIEKLSK